MLNYRYRLNPSDALRETLDRHLNLYRQVYNHFLYRLNHVESMTKYGEINRLPDLKEWWEDLIDLHSRCLQNTVERLYDNLSTLKAQKENGRKVGTLSWKCPAEYRSFTYRQSGFKLKETSGRPVLRLSKIGEIPVWLHREVPDGATVKQVTVKREPTGRWYAIVGIEADDEPPAKLDCPKECVGIDVGILQYVHDTDGYAVGSLDLSTEQDRLEHEQRILSRRQHRSNNYRKQRRKVARRHADIKRKRRDFLHKLSNYYATEYDLVAVENLNVAGMMQFDSNSYNRASAAWGTFLRMLEYKCEREGTHFVAVDPRGTTKECAQCGVESGKPLWVREYSCPACGFEADRDENAAWNVLARGVERYNDPEDDKVGRGTAESTPVETVVPTSIAPMVVDANHVAETGSPALNERAARRAKLRAGRKSPGRRLTSTAH